jgi:hypothetical protein
MQGNDIMSTGEAAKANATRLEELRARKADREKARQLELDGLELQELELEEAHLGLGKRGIDFEIVTSEVGFVVVKKPDFQTASVFNAVAVDKRTETEVLRFVMPSVAYPKDQAAFRAMVSDHGGILWRCAAAVLAMYEAKVEARTGKF